MPLPPNAWAQPESITWLELPKGLNYNLIAASDGRLDARIPAFLTAGAIATGITPKVRVYDAVFNEGRSEELATQFTARFTPPSDTVASALLVSAANAAKLPPGTYALTIQVGADKDPKDTDAKDTKPQLLTLSLTRYPAQLAGPGSIILSKVSGGSLNGDEDTTTTVTLRESSNKAAVTGLRFFDVREAMASGAQPTGKIKVAFAPRDVPIGGATEATVGTEGEFPLGTSKGKLDIVSPDLANAVSIGYEVRTRRGLWTIAFFAALGALLGWWVRVRTAGASALAAAHLSASRAIQLAREEAESSDDATYRNSLATLRRAMEGELETADPAKITLAVKTLEDGVAAARSTLQAELVRCAAQDDGLKSVVGPAWELPNGTGQALEQLRAAKGDVELLLEKRNAKAASTTLQRITAVLLPTLVNQATNDGTGLADYLVDLRTMGPPLPETVRAQIVSEGDGARAQFPAGSATVPVATPEEASTSLQKIDRQYRRARSLAEQLPSIVDEFVAREWARLHVDTTASKEALERLRKTSMSHAKDIVADVYDPAKGPARLRARAAELRQGWLDGFVAAGAASKQEELRQALNDGKWSEAVDLAASSLATGGTRLGGDVHAVEPLSAESANRLDIDNDRILSEVDGRSTSVELPALVGSAGERVVLYRSIKRSAALQSVFFAILFIVGVYVFYADSWVGTNQELLAIFLLGFGVDLTSERVLALLKNPKAG